MMRWSFLPGKLFQLPQSNLASFYGQGRPLANLAASRSLDRHRIHTRYGGTSLGWAAATSPRLPSGHINLQLLNLTPSRRISVSKLLSLNRKFQALPRQLRHEADHSQDSITPTIEPAATSVSLPLHKADPNGKNETLQRMGFTPHLNHVPFLELFFDFLPAHVQQGSFDIQHIRILLPALDAILPPDSSIGPVSSVQNATSLASSNDSATAGSGMTDETMSLGSHLPMFPYPVHPTEILSDGTDTRFLPGPVEKWPYRLWSSGSITLNGRPPAYESGSRYSGYLVERPTALSVKKDPTNGSHVAKVTVSKSIYDTRRVPSSAHGSKDFLDMIFQSQKSGDDQAILPAIEEKYTLAFLQEKPIHLSYPPRYIKPPHSKPLLSHSLSLNRHLLFAWSAATMNAHLIHLDPTFAEENYGAPTVLVHGPLTLFLVLEWFRRSLTGHTMPHLGRFHLQHIDYKILLPIFVDESIFFCASPKASPLPDQLAEKWDIWIEKDMRVTTGQSAEANSKAKRTTVFRGTIKIILAKGTATKTHSSVARDSLPKNANKVELR